jgi:hypothetical protein
MSTIAGIEDAVRRLSPGDLAAFREWFVQLDAEAWDRQIEEDVAAGRLDSLAEEALEDLRQGRCTDRGGIVPTRDSGVVTTLFRPKFGNWRTRLINGCNRTPGIPRYNSRKWALLVGASGAALSNARRGTRVGHRVVLDWTAC